MNIAFLACPETLPGSPTRRPDAFEHDLQLTALREGLGTRADVTAIDWRAPLDELPRFDLAILGTPWDYTEAKDEFIKHNGFTISTTSAFTTYTTRTKVRFVT